jgi:hypothetical protein
MRNNIKIQNKCIQTRLSNEGQLIDYRLTYPISKEFKWYLQTEEPDEHDHVYQVKDKRGRFKSLYMRSTTDFKKVKHWMLLIMIKSSDFKIKEEQKKKQNLVSLFSNY